MAFFITLEGVEGSGKSTQIRFLQQHLAERGLDVVVTREPGGCPIADAIRSILLDPLNSALTARAELLLYAAARAQHIAEVIHPALAAGRTVLCDRFTDATTAYQGGGRGLDVNLVTTLNAIATVGIQPDLTLLLDFPVEQGLARARQRNRDSALLAEGRFEEETVEFHRRVRESYLAMAAQNPRFVVIDAAAPADLVAARIAAAVDSFRSAREHI